MLSSEKKLLYSYQFNNSIKVFISLYKFHQQLLNNKKEELSGEVVLIEKEWFDKFKKFYLCDKIYKLIIDNNLSDLDITEQKIIFNNLFNEFYTSNSNKNIILFYDEEFPDFINDNKTNNSFINNFDIINEEIYKKLLNSIGMFKYCNANAKKYEYKQKEKKIMIKYENEEEKCFNLLIGNIGNNCSWIYFPEAIISFPNKDLLQIEFKNIDESITNYCDGKFNPKRVDIIEQNSLPSNTYKTNIKFLFHKNIQYPNFGTYANIKKKIQKKIKSKNIIEALVYYYLNNKKLISNNIKDREDQEKFCFLINKSWINKVKNSYKYNLLIPELRTLFLNEKFSKYIQSYGYNVLFYNSQLMKELLDDNSLKTLSNKLDDLDEKKIIDELRNLNLFLIDFKYHEEESKSFNYIKLYEDFEIITFEKNKQKNNENNNLIDILFPLIEKKFKIFKYKKNEENYFFFYDDNNSEKIIYACSPYEKNDEININLELIIKGKNIEKVMKEIEKNTFINYISSLNFDNNLIAELDNSYGKVFLLKNENGKINKLRKEKESLEIMLINFVEFIQNIKFIQKKPGAKINNTTNFIYLSPKENIERHLNKYNLKFSEINEIINNEKLKLEDKKKSLSEYINKNFKSNKKEKDFLNNEELLKLQDSIKKNKKDGLYFKINNNQKIYYYSDIILLDENVIKYLNIKKEIFTKLDYYNKEKYIFLFVNQGGNNINVNVGILNKENSFELDFLFNTSKSIEEILYIMNSNNKTTMEQFYQSSFMFKNIGYGPESNFCYFSPFFDNQYNIIGYAYKPSKERNSIISCYNQLLINNIYFIIYFNFPKYQNMTSNSGKYYYLISERWIDTFKKKNKIEELKAEIVKTNDKNLNVMINVEQKDKKLLNKMICKLICDNYKVVSKFSNDNNYIEHTPEPDYGSIQDNGQNLWFYNNFYLLDEDIHNKIFEVNELQSDEMKKRNYFCKCFYEEEYIFIRLNKYLTQSDKIVYEVGNLDNNVFKLIYLLILNSEEDFNYNLNLIMNIKPKIYFSGLNFNSQNFIPLDGDNDRKNIGYIYKYSEDFNKNIDVISADINKSINIFEQQIKPDNIPNSLRNIFQQAPQIGLKNVGATCYMNATIQCFGQIEKFALYFAYHPHVNEVYKKNKGRDCLSKSFKELIENLWPCDIMKLNIKYRKKNANNDYYIPEKFKETISRMNPLFQGAQANDSKDLVNFIVMQLHEELNIGKKLDNNQDMIQNDELSIYNNFCQANSQENKSIISDLFYGINGTVYECTRCKTKKYNFQIGFFYIFPLEEVRQFKIRQSQQQFELNINNYLRNNAIDPFSAQNLLQMNNNQLQNISSVTLYDCFEYNQKLEYMMGENAMHCNICQKTENCVYQSYITNPPEIMIIILNRGQGIQYRVKCDFVEFLNIGPYVRYSNNTPYNYGLIGVVTHMGESGASGHFVAFCRSPIDNQWYNYNDDLCFPVQDLKREVIDYAMPYILFYQKM